MILDLLFKGEFPRVHCPPPQSREVLWLLRYRHRLIRMRTQIKNSLRALALSAGSVKKMWLFGPCGRAELFSLPMTAAMSHQRDGWLELLADLSERVVRLDEQLKQTACGDERVLRWQTHPHVDMIIPRILQLKAQHQKKLTDGKATMQDIITTAGSILIIG